jgi:hypothetical protein
MNLQDAANAGGFHHQWLQALIREAIMLKQVSDSFFS